MQKTALIIVACLYAVAVQAQVYMNKDSLLRLLPSAPIDTHKVQLYINIGQQYESSEPETAKQYYRQALGLSKELGYKRGEIRFITNYTYILNMQGSIDSSIMLNLHSVDLARKLNDIELLGKTLFNTGTAYQYAGVYDSAVYYYESGKKYFEKLNSKDITAKANDILQSLYKEMGQYDRAIELGESAMQYYRQNNDPIGMGITLSNLGNAYAAKGKLDKALPLYQEALTISHRIGHTQLENTLLLNIANVHLQRDESEQMMPYFRKALVLSKTLGSQEDEAIAYRGMCVYYMYKKDFHTANRYIDSSLAITTGSKMMSQHQRNLEAKSSVLYGLHDVAGAEAYLREGSRLADSIRGESIQQHTLQIEKKFETAKKESQIKQLEAEKKVQQLRIQRKNTFNLVLAAGAIVLLVLTLLSYRNYKQNQKLQQQRINELEIEKQLTVTEAVLKGEEKERTRLAKDLHDGLGGMLSGIKYSFQNMKGNLVMTPENQQAFERSMDMLDSSIREMRRVAHNMMPEALVKFGLDTALKDFCHDINQSGALRVNYQSIGLAGTSMDQTTAITIYRVVQELVNNIIRHAAAGTALVQISRSNHVISITVEDDGFGFDTTILEEGRGIGWSSIRNRIEFLKGKVDVKSSPGKGTSVLIELGL